jgi:hypothetical protein
LRAPGRGCLRRVQVPRALPLVLGLDH